MNDTSSFTEELEENRFAYLTTTGRVTGNPHQVEIWFTVVEGAIYLISGGGTRSDWVKNILINPCVKIEIDGHTWPATARALAGVGDHFARKRLAARYQDWRRGQPLTSWATNGLVVEVRIR